MDLNGISVAEAIVDDGAEGRFELDRRELLASAGWAAAMTTIAVPAAIAETAAADRPVACFNTAVLRGKKLPIDDLVDIAHKAGFRAIEPWIDELERHKEQGKSLDDLNKKIADLGMTVESGIGFAEWLVDDDARRKKGLENARKAMALMKRIGGQRIAAPPAGATDQPMTSIGRAAERYRALLAIGREHGVTPQLEVWGFSKSMGKLSEVVAVAVESDEADALVLADVYHLYKGGSGFHGVGLISGRFQRVFHVNDYPSISREKINDADRVFPGDGSAPLDSIMRDLRRAGFTGALSLEVFNREYWKRDSLEIARLGFEKTQRLIDATWNKE